MERVTTHKVSRSCSNWNSSATAGAMAKPRVRTCFGRVKLRRWLITGHACRRHFLWFECGECGPFSRASILLLAYFAGRHKITSDPNFRPMRPSNCPESIWTLMQRCWSFQAKDRPSFQLVADVLKAILDRGDSGISLDVDYDSLDQSFVEMRVTN